MAKYDLKTDAGTVTVELAVPAGWTEDAAMSGPDGPIWKLAGARHLGLAVVEPNGSDPAARMTKAIRMQYGDGEGAERTELGGGRVWMTRKEGNNLHARLFVPFETGVVMGVAMLAEDGEAQLPAIKQAFESIAIAPAA